MHVSSSLKQFCRQSVRDAISQWQCSVQCCVHCSLDPSCRKGSRSSLFAILSQTSELGQDELGNAAIAFTKLHVTIPKKVARQHSSITINDVLAVIQSTAMLLFLTKHRVNVSFIWLKPWHRAKGPEDFAQGYLGQHQATVAISINVHIVVCLEVYVQKKRQGGLS